MKNFELTKEEKEIEEAIEKGEYQNVNNFEEWKTILSYSAKKTLEEIEMKRLVAKFRNSSLKKKAIQLPKEKFGDEIEIL